MIKKGPLESEYPGQSKRVVHLLSIFMSYTSQEFGITVSDSCPIPIVASPNFLSLIEVSRAKEGRCFVF